MRNVLTTLFDIFVWGLIVFLFVGAFLYFTDYKGRSSWLEEQTAECYRQRGQAYLVKKTLTCYRKNDYTTPIFKITYPEVTK